MKMLEAAYVIQEGCRKNKDCSSCTIEKQCGGWEMSPLTWNIPEQPHTSTTALTVKVKATELEPVKELFDLIVKGKRAVDAEHITGTCAFNIIVDKFIELFGDQYDLNR